MVREVLIRLIAIGALIAAGTAAVAAEGRHALVVGVNDYQNVPKLQKAVGDARAMKTALERAGFTVDLVLNPDRRGFNLAISNFSRKLRAGDVALFHFSGHGVALDGENYLLPTDVPAPGDGDKELLKLEAMPLTGVLERIRDAGARTEILIIDACRDNPYAGRGKRSFGVRGGLAQIQPPRGPGGVFILYSAGYGQTAADRLNDKDTEPTSVYTRTLLRKITVEGKPITDIAREVREDVEALAATIGHAQRPAYYDELSGPPFYFVPPSGKSQTAARSPAIELAFWNSIKDSRNAALFRDYLAKFGDRAVFASIANAKIRELAAPAQPPAVQPQPQSPRPIVPPVAALPTPDANNFQPSFDCAQDTGRIDDTMIVFTSDHGDYLGDHWLGEKELFHEQSVRVPLIIVDPDPAADRTRGTVERRFVEALDMVPTFMDAVGINASRHRLEGRSILSLLRGPGPSEPEWRDAVFSEIDYGFYRARDILKVGPSDARGYMIRTDRWKYIYFKGFRPQLFDLDNDPEEFIDLGEDAAYQDVCAELREKLFQRLLARRNRVTMSDEQVTETRNSESESGIVIGRW